MVVTKTEGVVAKAEGTVAKADVVVEKPEGVIANAEGVIVESEGIVAKAETVIAKAGGLVSDSRDHVAEQGEAGGLLDLDFKELAGALGRITVEDDDFIQCRKCGRCSRIHKRINKRGWSLAGQLAGRATVPYQTENRAFCIDQPP